MMGITVKSSRLWPLLSEPQRLVVAALEEMSGENPTTPELAAKLGRHPKGVARIIKQLESVGLYTRMRRGREGGGRRSDMLIPADLFNVSAVEAIGHALLARKAMGHAKSGRKAMGHVPLIPLLERPLIPLLSAGPISSQPAPEYAVAPSKTRADENLSGEVERGSIVEHNHHLVDPSSIPRGDERGERDWIEHRLANDWMSEGEVDWYDSHVSADEGPAYPQAPLVLAIDPGSLYLGWALLGGPAPCHVDSGAELVPGADANERAAEAGKIMARLIATHRPALIVIEQPDYQKRGISLASLETFHKSFRAIDGAVRAARLPYHYLGATESARGLANGDKGNIKQMKMEFFASVVGRSTNEHTADAFHLGFTYLMERLQPSFPPL